MDIGHCLVELGEENCVALLGDGQWDYGCCEPHAPRVSFPFGWEEEKVRDYI